MELHALGLDLDAEDDGGITPVFEALRKGHDDVALYLILRYVRVERDVKT